jgi:hypothetical protein
VAYAAFLLVEKEVRLIRISAVPGESSCRCTFTAPGEVLADIQLKLESQPKKLWCSLQHSAEDDSLRIAATLPTLPGTRLVGGKVGVASTSTPPLSVLRCAVFPGSNCAWEREARSALWPSEVWDLAKLSGEANVVQMKTGYQTGRATRTMRVRVVKIKSPVQSSICHVTSGLHKFSDQAY